MVILSIYELEGKGVLSLLPDEVDKEDDGEVVIGSDQTTEKSHVLSYIAKVVRGWRGRSSRSGG